MESAPGESALAWFLQLLAELSCPHGGESILQHTAMASCSCASPSCALLALQAELVFVAAESFEGCSMT